MTRLPGLLFFLFCFSFVTLALNMIREASVPKNTDILSLSVEGKIHSGDGSECNPYTIESLPRGDYCVSALTYKGDTITLKLYAKYFTLTSEDKLNHTWYYLALSKTKEITSAMEGKILRALLVKDGQELKLLLPHS